KLGWRSRDVGIWPGTLTKLRMKGFIQDFYESNSYHGYKLTETARALLAGTTLPSATEAPQGQKLEVPDDMFEDIIGHNEVKELLRASLLAEKPVHVLLSGPPALAKSIPGNSQVIVMNHQGVHSISISEAHRWFEEGKHFYALGVEQRSLKSGWGKVSGVIKESLQGRLLRIRLRGNLEIMATKGHSFLAYEKGELVPVPGSNLRVGDVVPVVTRCQFPELLIQKDIDGFSFSLDEGLGFIIGLWLAEGSFWKGKGKRRTQNSVSIHNSNTVP
ncbi:unnamed protein product, partial [marine sediment metagenome]